MSTHQNPARRKHWRSGPWLFECPTDDCAQRVRWRWCGPRAGNDLGYSLATLTDWGRRGGVSEEEMEYSTSRDIGQTRSRSAKMMGECPLETRRRTDDDGHLGCSTLLLQRSRAYGEWTSWDLSLDLLSSVRDGWQLTRRWQFCEQIGAATTQMDDTDGRSTYGKLSATSTMRHWHFGRYGSNIVSEQLDTRDSAVIFRTRVNRVGKHTKTDTKTVNSLPLTSRVFIK